MRDVVLALGSNLGDSAAILQGAVSDLASAPGLTITVASGVYETDPVGGPDQDPYLNAVLLGRTTLDDEALLRATQAVERAWHRVRDVRWGPRTLDVDIIAIGDERIVTADLEVPHPRAHERAFVLVPWLDADPAAAIPGRGAVRDLLAGLDDAGVRATGGRLTVPGAAEMTGADGGR
jgi:2-amino-4-hydroxy-6-hydroxymethyldihydropteridine diphosphokinase